MAKLGRPADAAQLDEAIELVYRAALDEALWHEALRKITAVLGGVGSVLARGRPHSGQLELTWIQEHVPAIEGRWDHYRAYQDFDIRTAHGLSSPPLAVYTDNDFTDDRTIDRHPFYQEFMACYDLRYTIGSRLPAEADEVGIVNVFRSRQQGHHGPDAAERMEALAPHLARACAIDQRLAAARRRQRQLRDALDRVPDAIFLLAPDGKIVDANRAAEQLLRARDGLSAPQSRLGASHAPSRKPLAEAIAAAAARRIHPGMTQALPIPRPSGGRPLQALVIPMPRADPPIITALPAPVTLVMLVVSDPDTLPVPLAVRLAVLWGLTPAESRLAAALASGQSVQEYADQYSLTENTVRWTLKRLLAKTDCRRQPEMVRLLATAATFW